jgi:hypothetical protein
MTALEQFFAQIGAVAQRHGIKSLVIAARDPGTGEAKVMKSPNGLVDLREPAAKAFGFAEPDDAETGWVGN